MNDTNTIFLVEADRRTRPQMAGVGHGLVLGTEREEQ